MKEIAVLFSGTGTNLQYILEHLHAKEVEKVALVEGILKALNQ